MANVVLASTADAGMIDYPVALQATGGDAAIQYAAGDHLRTLLDALVTSEGVLTPTGWKLSQRAAGANFSVDIAIGDGVIKGDQAANQGKYLCRTTAVVNLGTPSAPGTGTRVHRVIARVRDKQIIGTGTYDWTVETLEDTGSGTPALPASAVDLGTVSIAAGQANVATANITDTRPFALLAAAPAIVGRNQRTTDIVGITTITRVLSTVASVFAGRTYRVTFDGEAVSDLAAATSQHELRYTTNNTEPTTVSPVLDRAVVVHSSTAAIPDQVHVEGYFHCGATGVLRVALCTLRAAGSVSVAVAAAATFPAKLIIEDCGATVSTSGTVY